MNYIFYQNPISGGLLMMNDCLIRNDEKTAYRVIENKTIVVNLDNSTFHTLNPVGSIIWENLDGKTPIKSIVKKISDEFNIDFDTAQKDCLEFINDLIEKNLIIVCSNQEEEI